MSFLEILIFLVSIPGYIGDFIQLFEWISTYFKSKKKAKSTNLNASAQKT